MNALEALKQAVKSLPEPLAREVLDFLLFIRERRGEEAGPEAKDYLAHRIAHPWKVEGFKPLTREEAHER